MSIQHKRRPSKASGPAPGTHAASLSVRQRSRRLRLAALWCRATVLALASSVVASPPTLTTEPASQTIFIGDQVTFRVAAGGSAPLGYQWFKNDTALAGATESSLVLRVAAGDDDARFTVRISNAEGTVTSAPATLTVDFGMPGPPQTNRWVEVTSVWRYHVADADLGTAWRGREFSDAAWGAGGGLLYVENSALPAPKTTPLPLTAGDLPNTAYFRTTFTNDLADAYAVELVANTVIDDGAVWYLNGAETLRLGMPEGAIAHATAANRTVGDAAWEGPFTLTSDALLPGVNVLAAEVHQSGSGSSDLVLGLTLDAVWRPRLPDTQPPLVADVVPAPGTSLSELTQIRVRFDEGVSGVKAADLRANGQAATNVTRLAADLYLFSFAPLPNGPVSVAWAADQRIVDRSVRSNAFAGTGFGYVVAPASDAVRLTFREVRQSSDAAAANAATQAVDGVTGSFSLTQDLPGSYWRAELARPFPVERIEVLGRPAPFHTELSGLTLRLFDLDDQVVFETGLTNVGASGLIVLDLPANTRARALWIGLPGTETNAAGNYRVGLAEVRLLGRLQIPFGPDPVSGTNNLASFKPSWMLRLDDSVPPASRANDNNPATETKTTERTVDGYWEVDLGDTYALYGVRAIAARGIGSRLTNTIVRLFDATHESVHAQPVTGAPDVFEVDLNGPRFARYVRIGLEDKQRTDPAGGIEFYIGFREVEVFGRPTNEVGVLSFTASTNRVAPGEPVTLSWAVEGVHRAEIRPGIGSVGAHTAPNGLGQLTLALAHSTEFLLVATNAAGVFSRAVAIEVASEALPVRLEEVVAANRFSLKDGDNNAPDWIELRNPGETPVALTGWGLSDDPARPMKWRFPTTTLAPHATLIVFASGRESPRDPGGYLHASFRLDKAGGALRLTAPNGTTTVDQLTYPALDDDLAYGRDLEGHWTFLEPTPAAINTGQTYRGWLPGVEWSHARGFYETGFTLTLATDDPVATVLYSLDGSIPSQPYTTGLPISRTSVVRAQAVRPGYRPAPVGTRTFLFLSDVLTSSVLDRTITQDARYASRLRPGLLALPSLSLVLPGEPEYEEKEGSLEILWPQGGAPVQVNCGLARFGNAWTKYAKRSFRVKCRPRYGVARLEAPLFDGFDRGVPAKRSFDTLDLRSGSQDMYERGFYMASRFVEDSMLDMGSLNPHGRFVHVYLNGVYWGQYDCRELLEEHFLADYLGGATEDYVAVRGNDNVGDDFVPGMPDPPQLEPWELTRAARNSYLTVRSRLDVSHLIDFMLLWNYGNSESEFRACGPIAPGSGFKFWIADADGFLRTGALGLNRTGRVGPGSLFGGLMAERHPDFRTLLADRIYRHFFNGGALTPSANDARLAARMQEVRDSLILECARWGYRTPANWASAASAIRTSLFPARTTQLLGYLRNAGWYPAFDPPTFDRFGGLVARGFTPVLTSASGTIYYTLDGTDPRLSGGGVAPAARVWSPGAVVVTGDLTLSARVRSPAGAWSALAQPRYFVAPRRAPAIGDLLVTEIHYNPAGSDDFEFVELWNASSNVLDLEGVSLGNAVSFAFPSGAVLDPGAFAVITEDRAAFAERYQTPGSPYDVQTVAVAGDWTGSLDNAGETLLLLAASGIELAAVRYQPDGDWPARADGDGSSLELDHLPPAGVTEAELRAFVADGRRWRASALYHGSPGRFDDVASPVRINELLSHSETGDDWVELHNLGPEAVDLGGLGLTDNLESPARWLFPPNTVVAPDGYLVLDAARLGFAFSALGEEVHLLRLDGTNVIRFLDSVELPAVAPDESLGLFWRSDDIADFTELRAQTPGEPNALPRVGPVVISEIMWAPPPGRAQFIELANLTRAAVPLFDPERPTNRWRLQGVGAFEFPAGAGLEPWGTVIVCSTNPAAFRAQYMVSPTVPVFGPWTGVLDADGETIELRSPGWPEPDVTVPYSRVDRVRFRAQAPWPSVVPGGSLERHALEAYGNDPASWRAGEAGGTPGETGLRLEAAYRAGRLELNFTVQPGAVYQVEECTDLSVGDWRLWQEIVATEARVVLGVEPLSDPEMARFYRVRRAR